MSDSEDNLDVGESSENDQERLSRQPRNSNTQKMHINKTGPTKVVMKQQSDGTSKRVKTTHVDMTRSQMLNEYGDNGFFTMIERNKEGIMVLTEEAQDLKEDTFDHKIANEKLE